MARRARSPAPATPWPAQRSDIECWRAEARPQVLRFIAESTRNCPWTGRLLLLLLDELYIDDEFVELVGPPDRLLVEQYAQAVTVALALRHSWRPDDLFHLARRLGVTLEPQALGPIQAQATSATPKGNGRTAARTRPHGKKRRHPPRPAGTQIPLQGVATRSSRGHLHGL